jgi:opacity protein-like surface antigen
MKKALALAVGALALSGCVVAADPDLYPATFNNTIPSPVYYNIIYDDCDVWSEFDKERLSNFIITRSQRSEAQHISGLNYFRNKYSNESFNVCYDHLVNPYG